VRYDGSAPTLAGTISTGNIDPEEQFVRVYDSSGQLTFDNSGDESEGPADRQAVEVALAGGTATRSVDFNGEPFRVRVVPITQDGAIAGALEVGRAADDAADTLGSLLLILGVAYPVTLALASLGGVFLASRALAPIDKLTRLANRISAEDLSQRLDLRLPDDEIGRLARTFDDMIARLDDAFRRQRQFTADASHELRTPLTAVKGQVEVALNRPREADTYRESCSRQRGGPSNPVGGSLLTLARADAGQIPLSPETVDVGTWYQPP
jgi:signal transduction histidine kinase